MESQEAQRTIQFEQYISVQFEHLRRRLAFEQQS